MTEAFWKKVNEVEPGIYWYGGTFNEPNANFVVIPFFNPEKRLDPIWLAKICDLPPLPKMPEPLPEKDEPVMVRDDEGYEWKRRYATGVIKNGLIETWCGGATSWSTDGHTTTWRYWRRPTKEELEPK